MDIMELQKKLLAAARLNSPSDRVPIAFERRVMARLASEPSADLLAVWNRMLWRAAAPCVAVTLLVGAWSLLPRHPQYPGEMLASDLESALYVPFDSPSETW